jgi:ectoine hydroxylase-related dioxygenase (phytanoyl-CoA dioxygenase family)
MDWRAEIRENGFAILPELVAHDELDHLLDLIGIERAGAPVPQRSRAGLRHALKLPQIADLARQLSLIEIARGVLGARAFPFRATLFDKSQTANWLVVWHQDTALPLQSRHEMPGWGPWSIKEGVQYAHAPSSALSQILALRISLDDSTADNGPLRVLPATHTLGVLSDDAIHELSQRVVAADCVVPKGGVLAMRPLLIHSSSKSQADLPRRVLHIEYAASESVAEPLNLAIA